MSLLTVDSLSKSYKSKKVVDNVSFDIRKGEVFGLLGENGAGKTTTIKMLTTLTRPDDGVASILGVDILNDGTKAKRLMSAVSQDNNLDVEISVFDNLLIYAKLRKLKNPHERVRDILYGYNISDKADEKVQNLSGGQKRRVMIARAMLADAELIFMDEPTVGLDPSVRREIWQIIKSIRSLGKSILMTTHYTEEAENLCDRIAIMHKGKIVCSGTPSSLIESAGAYALDTFNENRIRTILFSSESELNEFAVRENITSFKARCSRLEDVVIKCGEVV